MRLIDVDVYCATICRCNRRACDRAKCPIHNAPTAYDIDKAVEELEEMKMRYFLTIANTGDEKSDFAYENVGNALDKAIEIVKQCCVTDDVCEWKLDGVYLNSPHKPLVSCITDENDRYYYCPVCGKKIKAVE